MNADLEHLIVLQRLDSAAQDAKRRLAEEPERERVFDADLNAARDAVAAAKSRLAESQSVRREHEKTVTLHQGRLSKFREQAMAVKTNQEYHAIQKEIEFAQTEMKAAEDQVLERMLEADDLTAAIKRAEAELASAQKKVEAGRKAMAAESAELTATLERVAAAGAFDVRAGLQPAKRHRRRRSPRRHLHDLPRASAAPGVQHRSAQRSDHPVRQLQPFPVFRAAPPRRSRA
jgi:predicted  nucleic acid-binding Zn-ribbon protein